MKNDKQKDIWLYHTIVLVLALTLVASVGSAIALALAGSFIAGVMIVFNSPLSESPAEFLVLTYLYR